jgi:DNA invertase Pin-like site-specific DNA recombinase
MSRPRRIGVSYARYSDPKQSQGDSEGRQDRMYRDFCQRHNLTPLTDVYLDKGRSGYKDEHRKKGRLGVLIGEAKDGKFEPGTVIVVEAWDRLGRLRPDKQTALVAELLQTGVDIGVCQLNDVFTEADFGTHKWVVLSTFIMLAYQESKQKGERVGGSWLTRRTQARANGTPLTGRTPAWVERVGDELRLIPERAVAVKKVFLLAGRGYGYKRIVRTLTDEGVPPIGSSGKWSKAYVALLLNDRRVLGELQPRTVDGKAEGQVIPDYYPPVVTEQEFLLAQASRDRRTGKDRLGRAVGHRDRKYVNVFQGLLRNALDGQALTLHNRGTSRKTQLVLINVTSDEGRSRCRTFPYHVFEEWVLRLLREVDPKDVLPRSKAGPSKADVLRANLFNVRQDLAGIQAELKAGFSKALVAVLREKEAEEEAVAGQLQDELVRSARPADRAWQELPGLADMVKKGGDEARLRLRPVLKRVVAGLWAVIVRRGSCQLCAVQAWFADSDQHRDYLVVSKAAGFKRPGGSWAMSFAATLGPGDYDQRQKADALRLEADLAALDLAGLSG